MLAILSRSQWVMMTSCSEDAFRVTVPLWVNAPVSCGSPSQMAGNVELWCCLCCWPELDVEQTVHLAVIWDAIIVFILLQGIRFTIHSFDLVQGCQDVISIRHGGYYYSHSTRQLCDSNIEPIFYSDNTNAVSLVFSSIFGGSEGNATGFNITYEAFDPNAPMTANPEGNDISMASCKTAVSPVR